MKTYVWTSVLLLSLSFSVQAHAQDPPKRITIQMKEYQFSPSKIDLKRGEIAELVLVNPGKVVHEFVTDALKDLEVDLEINGVLVETVGIAELEVPPGGKAILRFTPEKPGEFEFTCRATEPVDHLKEGMSGVLQFR